jgi:hypothetical protein
MASPARHAVTSHNDISCVTSGEVLVFRAFAIFHRGPRSRNLNNPAIDPSSRSNAGKQSASSPGLKVLMAL